MTRPTRCAAALPAARAATSRGSACVRKCWNGLSSRKKKLSLVVIASTTSRASASLPGRRSRSASAFRSRQLLALQDAARAGFPADRACLADDQAGAGLQQCRRTSSNDGGRSVRWSCARHSAAFRAAFGAMRGSGSTAWHRSRLRDRARHAPHHAGRLVLRDRRAAGFDHARGCRPGRPAPCRSASRPARGRRRPPRRCAASDRPRGGRNSPADRLVSRARSRPMAAFDQQMPVARREIDAARPTSASPSFASAHGRPPSRVMCSARIGVKVAGMCWVSTTGTLSELAQSLDQREQRLRAAGGTADREQPRRHDRRRPQARARRVARAGCATAAAQPRQALHLLPPVRAGTSSSPCADRRRLRHVVRRAQPQRAQRDVGAARGQRRGHDDLAGRDRPAAAAAARSCRPSPASRYRAPARRPGVRFSSSIAMLAVADLGDHLRSPDRLPACARSRRG